MDSILSQLKSLSPEEVGEFTGLRVSTLTTWRNRPPRGGGIPYVKVGRRVRYLESDVVEFLRRNRRQHTSEIPAAVV